MDRLLAWLKENHHLIAGAADFIAMLQDHGITPVAITNGAKEIAGPMLVHHGLNMPFVSNWLNFDGPSGAFSGMGFLHNAEDAIRKGDLVRLAHSEGYVIVGCAGDSRGDICLSEATAALNGIVLASGAGGGLSVWCAQQSHPEGILVADQCLTCLTFSDFNEVKAAVLERISQL
ncbi:hypothetical protein GC174_18190 [bacterium]|nr:hypothetical protein [bacterium]